MQGLEIWRDRETKGGRDEGKGEEGGEVVRGSRVRVVEIGRAHV